MQIDEHLFFNGALTITQPAKKHGYRFCIDAILLAGFCPNSESCLDLGAGCGIVGLSLLHHSKTKHVSFVEIQQSMADLIGINVERNHFSSQSHITCSDVVNYHGNKFDLICTNPPYFKHEEGYASPETGRAQSRHERSGLLLDFVMCAARHLSEYGQFCIILPIQREQELRDVFSQAHLKTSRYRYIRPRAQVAPKHILYEAMHANMAPTEAIQERDCVVHADAGYTDEVAAWLC